MGNKPSDARGFVLLTALWLLLLASIIGSAIMLSGLAATRGVARLERLVRADLAASSTFEAVAYDLLTQGGRSRWARGRSSGMVTEDGMDVMVTSSDEEGRIDVNAADPADIDKVLAELRVPTRTRRRIIEELQEFRSRGRVFTSLAELASVQSLTPFWECVVPHVTVITGHAKPLQRGTSAVVERAVYGTVSEGVAHDSDVAGTTNTGRAYRVGAAIDGRVVSTRIIRIAGGSPPVWVYEDLGPGIFSDQGDCRAAQ